MHGRELARVNGEVGNERIEVFESVVSLSGDGRRAFAEVRVDRTVLTADVISWFMAFGVSSKWT